MYNCMIYMYLTKQVNRLKLVGLPTKTSDLAKLYTMDKIGTESCQMVKKRNHKFHNRLWNAYSYLKGCIMEFGKYLRTVIPGRRSRRPLATPPAMGYIRRTETVGCQSGSDHSHPMVSVMSLLLNLLFLFCMHLFRLRYLTVCLIYMLYGFVTLNLIWLYNYWHIYKRLPTHENSQDGKSTDPFCHVSLTLALSPSLLFLFFFSLSLSPLLYLYFISLPQLSLVSFEDSDPGVVGLSVPDRNLSYSVTLLSLSLPRSGKGPCMMRTSKKMQWKVGSRYINPIQPYRFCRRLYRCYQKRLCAIIQLDYEDVLVVIWFPCWGPVWSMGWDANAMLLFFYSTAPRTSCLGSPVARYHRLFESRPVNSTRRETYQQLATCSSPPYSFWFAPLSVPPGSPAALGPVTEPLGGKRPRVALKPHRRKH